MFGRVADQLENLSASTQQFSCCKQYFFFRKLRISLSMCSKFFEFTSNMRYYRDKSILFSADTSYFVSSREYKEVKVTLTRCEEDERPRKIQSSLRLMSYLGSASSASSGAFSFVLAILSLPVLAFERDEKCFWYDAGDLLNFLFFILAGCKESFFYFFLSSSIVIR